MRDIDESSLIVPCDLAEDAPAGRVVVGRRAFVGGITALVGTFAGCDDTSSPDGGPAGAGGHDASTGGHDAATGGHDASSGGGGAGGGGTGPTGGPYLYGLNRDYDPGPVTHWCDPTKVTDGAGTEADPFQPSQAMALEHGGAKKHVLWGAGTMMLPSPANRYIPALRPLSSGTTEFRIVHRALNPAAYASSGLTIVATNAPAAGAEGCPALGFDGVDDCIFDGFKVVGADAHYHPDTGHALFHDCERCEFHRCDIVGETLAAIGDNYCGFRSDQSVSAVIRNCRLAGIRDSATASHNVAAIMTYGSVGFRFEHNDLSDCNAILYVKGTAPAGEGFNSGEFRFNRCHNCYEALISQDIADDAELYIHHNLVTDFHTALRHTVSVAAAQGNAQNTRTMFNTFARQSADSGTSTDAYIVEYQDNIDSASMTFTDNIVVMRGITGARYIHAGNAPLGALDRNRYDNAGGSDRWEYNGVLYTDDLDGYRAAIGGEAGSSVGPPGFLDEAGGDFTGPTEWGCYGPGSETIGLQDP